MENLSLSFGLPGSPAPSHDYAAAVALLAKVIASSSASIAAETSRCRPDKTLLDWLQAERNSAIRAVTELHSDDPRGLREIVEHYRGVHASTHLRARSRPVPPPCSPDALQRPGPEPVVRPAR